MSFENSKYIDDWHINLDGTKLSGFSPVPPPGFTVSLQEGIVNETNGQIIPSPKPNVTLDYQQKGTRISVVIKQNTREALFTILAAPGEIGGEFNLAATAVGCQAVSTIGHTDH